MESLFKDLIDSDVNSIRSNRQIRESRRHRGSDAMHRGGARNINRVLDNSIIEPLSLSR